MAGGRVHGAGEGGPSAVWLGIRRVAAANEWSSAGVQDDWAVANRSYAATGRIDCSSGLRSLAIDPVRLSSALHPQSGNALVEKPWAGGRADVCPGTRSSRNCLLQRRNSIS